MSTDNAKSVASAIVGARLDYCNSLLYGVSAANLYKLQRVQNTLALQWLPVNFIITYKIAILTYKVKLTRQPQYLSEYR